MACSESTSCARQASKWLWQLLQDTSVPSTNATEVEVEVEVDVEVDDEVEVEVEVEVDDEVEVEVDVEVEVPPTSQR